MPAFIQCIHAQNKSLFSIPNCVSPDEENVLGQIFERVLRFYFLRVFCVAPFSSRMSFQCISHSGRRRKAFIDSLLEQAFFSSHFFVAPLNN